MFNPLKTKIADKTADAKKRLLNIAKEETGEFTKSLKQQVAPDILPNTQQKNAANPIVEAMEQSTNPESFTPHDDSNPPVRRLDYLQRELDELRRKEKLRKQQEEYQEQEIAQERQAQIEARQDETLMIPQGINRKAKSRGGGHQTKGTQELPKKVGG